jgi:hypothetical protein
VEEVGVALLEVLLQKSAVRLLLWRGYFLDVQQRHLHLRTEMTHIGLEINMFLHRKRTCIQKYLQSHYLLSQQLCQNHSSAGCKTNKLCQNQNQMKNPHQQRM